MTIRKAHLNEVDLLSDLSIRSKAFWGYDENFMRDAVGDPFAAEKFYLKVGCKKIGEYQSPVRKDRKLPILEYDLS